MSFNISKISIYSLWEMKNYTESQKEFETALAMRRTLHTENIKFLGDDQEIILSIFDTFNEVEIKFRIAKCHYENLQNREAAVVLQSIPQKQRLPKVNMLLAKVLSDGTETTKTAHKEVLKKCPFAFECIESLLTLGVKGNEVQSLIINGVSEYPCFDWVNQYIRGVSEIHNSRKYQEAIVTLSSIDSMKTNPKILALIGIAYYYSGEYDRSYSYLKKSYDIYPFMKEGIQKYALLCDMFKKTRELEIILRPSAVSPYHYTSENWFVMATYLYSCLKFEKAQYFITRVIEQYQNKNVDALILNAKILHGNKKSHEALTSLRNALKFEPHRFEAHRWTIEILLATDCVKDAQNHATRALKLLGESPRTLTLAASSYLRNPIAKEKAKPLLQKALEMNEFYAKAVFFLAQILVDDKDSKAAIKLLEKTTATTTNLKINLMLADLYAKSKNLSSALEQYTKVLNIDSTNRHALNGLMALGSATTSMTLDTTPIEDDSEIAENSSRNKNEESENELVWSDIEMDQS